MDEDREEKLMIKGTEDVVEMGAHIRRAFS
jgi:hypothetical protein